MKSVRRMQSGWTRKASRTIRPAAAAARCVESLERRMLFASIVVNSTADDAVAGDGLVTLREAITAANDDSTTDAGQTGEGADEITFNLGAGPHSINLNTELPALDHNVSIQGPGEAADLTVRRNAAATDAFGIFTVLAGGDVTFENLTVANGSATSFDGDGSGGGIFNRGGVVAVRACAIVDNQALYYGGGIANDFGGILELSDTSLLRNASNSFGGALYNYASAVATVTRCEIAGNYAAYSGGAVWNAFLSTLAINDSAVDFNASYDAGGIDNYDRSTLHLSNSIFNGNAATYFGGVIRNQPTCTTTIDGCTFTANQSSRGGAVFNFADAELDVADTTFANNTSYGAAGAIDNHGVATVRRSTFDGNTAGYGGGALWNDVEANLAAIDCTFTNNRAPEGGAIENREFATLSVHGCTFTGNTGDYWGGGAIYNWGGSVAVSESTFDANRGGYLAGAIYSDFELSVTASTFTNNSAKDGGAIYSSSLVLTSSTLFHNTALFGYGAAIYGGTMMVDHCTIVENGDVDTSVGGLYTTGSPVVRNSVISGSANGDVLSGGGESDVIEDSFIGDDHPGVDPLLGPLADNGGPTRTMALLPGSPLINAGDPAFVGPPQFDQRGEGFARILGGRIDIGAFEYNAAPTTRGIPTLTVPEDAANSSLNLRNWFNDAEDGPAGLVYSVVGNTNAALFSSVSVGGPTDVLTLDYADDGNGVAHLTVRATASAGAYVDSTFAINVLSVSRQVQLLIAQVKSLPLSAGNINSLTVKLSLKGGPSDFDKVKNFIDAVGAFVSGGKLGSGQGDLLIAGARDLLISLA
jgi:CSLREA domain-containing protein